MRQHTRGFAPMTPQTDDDRATQIACQVNRRGNGRRACLGMRPGSGPIMRLGPTLSGLVEKVAGVFGIGRCLEPAPVARRGIRRCAVDPIQQRTGDAAGSERDGASFQTATN